MLRAVAATAVLALADAAALPSVHAEELHSISTDAKWWAQMGDQVFYAPPASMMELSQEASNYYYAIGSADALTGEMKKHLVGGDGRWHIFHLPQGPSMLQMPTQGSRRESFSSLAQLQHGQVLPKVFPEYLTNASYGYPGNAAALDKEKAAVKPLTEALYHEYLTKITELGVVPESQTSLVQKDLKKSVSTRSNTNPQASANAVEFLQKELKAVGLSSCLQEFMTRDGKRNNVVAYIPGSSRETLTVGAHYDSRPYDGAAPGANDNGSGLAMLLALAKAFQQAKLKPVKDMYLVGFAGEEKGLLGSAAFVSGLLGEGEAKIPAQCMPDASFLQKRMRKIQGPKHSAIILDEVGWQDPHMKPTANLEAKDNALSFNLLNHLAQSNKLYNGGGITATHSNHPFGSDHMSFINRGMPAVLIINGNDEGYPSYHSSSDTIGNVNMTYATELSRMVLGGIVRVAGLQD